MGVQGSEYESEHGTRRAERRNLNPRPLHVDGAVELDDLTHSSGEWLRGAGPESDIVISSRIRLARNLADYPFLSTATATQRTEIFRRVTDAVAAIPTEDGTLVVNIDETDPIDRQVLVERHLVSRQHAAAEGCRGVTISPDERRALMINEEDHLRIQALRSGLELAALWDETTRTDDALSQQLVYSFDRVYGYLTACPTNVGTGIRVSVMLHLPALKLTKEIERVARATRDMRLAVRGGQGEGTDASGDFYQVSNQTTLGTSEAQIIKAFSEKIIPKMVEYEKTARDALVRHSACQLDDKIWRALGVLENARTIGTEEALFLLSQLRMGIVLNRIKHLDLDAINELFIAIQAAHLQKRQGSLLDGEKRSVIRADLIRDRLNRKNPSQN